MLDLTAKLSRFFFSEEGPTAVEYAVMLALIVVLSLASIRMIGTRAKKEFNTVSKSLASGS